MESFAKKPIFFLKTLNPNFMASVDEKDFAEVVFDCAGGGVEVEGGTTVFLLNEELLSTDYSISGAKTKVNPDLMGVKK